MKRRKQVNENVASILAVPANILPPGAARDYLLEAAGADQDVYAYDPMQLEPDPRKRRWNVWLSGQRFDLEVWLARFNQKDASQE